MTKTTSMTVGMTDEQAISNLNDLRIRKESLKRDIQADEKQIADLWQRLVTPPQQTGLMTPSKRMTGLLSTGMNVVDGLLLGWKLYRKFGKKGKFRR